jgi:hypothetical protein
LLLIIPSASLEPWLADWKAKRIVLTTVSLIMSGHCGVKAHLKRETVKDGMCVCLENQWWTEIAEKASHHLKKASIPLAMYLKSLAILEKASIYLKKSSKITEIFIRAPHF